MNREHRGQGIGNRETDEQRVKTATIHDHRDLIVWQKPMALAEMRKMLTGLSRKLVPDP